MPSISL